MSERERWIVYPLLFLALGAALRDKLLQRTWSEQLVCKQLIMIDDAGVAVGEFKGDTLKAGAVSAQVVDGKLVRQSGRPLAAPAAAAGFSIPQLLKYLQQSGVMRVVPKVQTPQSPAPQTPAPQTPSPPAQPEPPKPASPASP